MLSSLTARYTHNLPALECNTCTHLSLFFLSLFLYHCVCQVIADATLHLGHLMQVVSDEQQSLHIHTHWLTDTACASEMSKCNVLKWRIKMKALMCVLSLVSLLYAVFCHAATFFFLLSPSSPLLSLSRVTFFFLITIRRKQSIHTHWERPSDWFIVNLIFNQRAETRARSHCCHCCCCSFITMKEREKVSRKDEERGKKRPGWMKE